MAAANHPAEVEFCRSVRTDSSGTVKMVQLVCTSLSNSFGQKNNQTHWPPGMVTLGVKRVPQIEKYLFASFILMTMTWPLQIKSIYINNTPFFKPIPICLLVFLCLTKPPNTASVMGTSKVLDTWLHSWYCSAMDKGAPEALVGVRVTGRPSSSSSESLKGRREGVHQTGCVCVWVLETLCVDLSLYLYGFLNVYRWALKKMCAIYNIHTPIIHHHTPWSGFTKANIHISTFQSPPIQPFQKIKRPLSRRFSSEWSVATPSVARFPHLPPAFFAPWRPALRRPRSRFRVRETWLESACWWWWCLNFQLVELPVNLVEDLQFLGDD